MSISNELRRWTALFKDAFLFGLVFGLTNVVSYPFIVFAGRNLVPVEFGVFNALLGLLTLAGVFATSLQVAVTKVVNSRVDGKALRSLMGMTLRIALPSTALLTIVALPFASQIGARPVHFLLCGTALLTMILGCAATGFLVGLGKVRSQADLQFFGALTRLGVGWALMMVGLGISGALIGYVISYLIVLVLAYMMAMHACKTSSSSVEHAIAPLRVEVTSMTTFFIAFMPFTLDQFIVQLVNPAVGSAYAATATIAKLVFFASYPVTAIAYPHMLSRSSARSRAFALASASAVIVAIAGA